MPDATWFYAYALPAMGALLVLIVGWYAAGLAYRGVNRLLPHAYGVDRNFAPLLAQVTRYGIVIFAMVTALNLLGVASASIYAVLAAAGLAIALSLQNTLSNIAAGIMLIWLRPVAIGEYIEGDGVAGVVVEIGLFGTRLRSSSGLYLFTPNQKLWASAITNHSREPRRRLDVNITLPDAISLTKARAVLLKIAAADKRILADPAPTVFVSGFSGTTVSLQLRAWVATPDYLPALHAMTEEAKLALDRELRGNADAKTQVAVTSDPNAQDSGKAAPPG